MGLDNQFSVCHAKVVLGKVCVSFAHVDYRHKQSRAVFDRDILSHLDLGSLALLFSLLFQLCEAESKQITP